MAKEKKSETSLPKIIEEYLFGKRDDAIIKLAQLYPDKSVNEIIDILKDRIVAFAKNDFRNFKGNVKSTANTYSVVKNFDAKKFFANNWKYRPHYVEQQELEQVYHCIKNPLPVKRYKYKSPIYKFANTRLLDTTKSNLSVTRRMVKNDAKFYLSQNEDMMFAKLLTLKYIPKNLVLLNSQNDIKNVQKTKEETILQSGLFERRFSCCLYVFLDGDASKPFPYMRYDNEYSNHTNVFIANDERRKVFGESAGAPHFHFQNEKDALLCLRKFKDSDKQVKYRTGRCNAIDCPHLHHYLKTIDNYNPNTVDGMLQNGRDYGMPFLRFKKDKRNFDIDIKALVEKYKKETKSNSLYAVEKWLEQNNDLEEYKNIKNHCFGGLIKALDFIQFVCSRFKTSVDEAEMKALSDLEIIAVNTVMDSINLASSKNLSNEQNNQNYYQIEYDFDDERK